MKASPLYLEMLETASKIILLISASAYMTGRSIVSVDIMTFHLSAGVLFFFSQLNPAACGNTSKIIPFLSACLAATAMSGLNQISTIALLNVIIAFFIIQIFMSILSYKKFINVFITASLINLTLALLSMAGFSPIIDNPEGEPGGLFGNAPRLCYYLAITMPFAAEKYRFSLVFYAIAGILLKEIYLPVFAALIYIKEEIGHLKKRMWIPPVLLVIFMIFFSNRIGHSLLLRWEVWKPTIMQIFLTPVFGHGLGVFPYVSSQFIHMQGYSADNAFSSFLQFFFSCGLVGLAGLWIASKRILDDFRFTAAQTSLVFLAVLSIFEYPFEVPKLWLTICFIIAVVLKEKGAPNAVDNR